MFLEEKNNMIDILEETFAAGLKYGKDIFFSHWTLIDIARTLRNLLLILINGYSPLVPLLLTIFVIYCLVNRKWSWLILFVSFFIPLFLTAKFWYGGLYGRYSGFAAYGLAILIALIPNKRLYWLVVISILIVFIPTIIAYQQVPYPQIEKQLLEKANFSENDLLVLSDYQRPQLSYKNALYVNGDLILQREIETKIDNALKEGKRVLTSNQAANFPYWQYDGQQIHIISKGNRNKAVMKNFLEDKNLALVSESKNFPLLNIYEINIASPQSTP
jgi:hypothetical protein